MRQNAQEVVVHCLVHVCGTVDPLENREPCKIAGFTPYERVAMTT